MNRITLLCLTLTLLCSCQSAPSRKVSSNAPAELSFDCTSIDKGCLLKRNSRTVIIFFRGWASPSDMRNYRGERNRIHPSSWARSATDHLTRGEMALAPLELESSLFVVGSSHLGLTQAELDRILELTHADQLIFASHSGGYVGLRATLLPIPLSYWERVSGLWLLDNFYGAASMARDLERNFGTDFLRENCYGFVTDHNLANYQRHYASFCPQVRTRGVTHTNGVPRCLSAFERGEECID